MSRAANPPSDGLALSGGRRLRLVATLVVLSAALVAVLGVGVGYAVEAGRGAAVPPLPVLRPIITQTGPHFLFSINGPVQPLGVALSPAGDRVYVTESGGERETKVYDRDGHQVGALNPPGSSPASRVPVYVAVGTDGTVYISDRTAATIFTYGRDGQFLGRLDPPGLEGWQPLALSVSPQGNLLVTDIAAGRQGFASIGRDGSVIRRFGTAGVGPTGLAYPNGIASDSQGRLFVADSNNGRVLVLSAEGSLLWSIGRGDTAVPLGLPRGVVVDDMDRLYVADTMSHVVQVFEVRDQAPRLLFTLGSQGVRDGQFNFPNGLAMDASDRLYVTDRENNRVQVWTY